jgi:Holliday junction resolvase-like predicted endonuclease
MGCNNMMEQLNEVRAHPRNSKKLGAFGEAVAEVLLHAKLGQEVVVDAATREKPQGVDLITYNPESGRLVVAEVKATATEKYHRPRMNSKTSQMADLWAGSRAFDAGMDAVDPAGSDFTVSDPDTEHMIEKVVVQVDVQRDRVLIFDVDSGGKVAAEAKETYPLEDLVRFVDATSAADAASLPNG